MNKFWGDKSWRAAAYAEFQQTSLFGPEMVKQGNDQIVAAFRERLTKVAGFGFVPEPLPMRNSRNAICVLPVFCLTQSGSPQNHH